MSLKGECCSGTECRCSVGLDGTQCSYVRATHRLVHFLSVLFVLSQGVRLKGNLEVMRVHSLFLSALPVLQHFPHLFIFTLLLHFGKLRAQSQTAPNMRLQFNNNPERERWRGKAFHQKIYQNQNSNSNLAQNIRINDQTNFTSWQ